jgi:hypothetical protein
METENYQDRIGGITAQNAKLKFQLMNNSLVYELTKVLSSCTDEISIIKTLLLGIKDILGFDRVIMIEENQKIRMMNFFHKS